MGSLKSSMMQHRGAVLSSLVLLLLSTSSPADAFFFGRLAAFFQPSPLFGIPTFFTPKSVGGIYINAFPFTTPPAADCLQRALSLLNGCQPFLNALNANGGQLSKLTIFQILQLAAGNKTLDIACYNAAANFLNGGCICDNGLINTINILNTVPAFAKQALVSLNKAKCPPSPPPPPVAPVAAATPTAAPTTPAAAGPAPPAFFAGGPPPALFGGPPPPVSSAGQPPPAFVAGQPPPVATTPPPGQR